MTDIFLRNPRLTMLIICLILVSGISSGMLLPRMEDPRLVERAAFVNTIFPGADPSRVESLVTERIEDELHEIDEIKELRSSSQEGFSTIAIELRDDVYESEEVWSKLRDKLDDVGRELPAGAGEPEFVEMDFKAYAMLVALTWQRDGPPGYPILNRWAKQLDDRLRHLSGTEKIKLFGQPREEVQVLIDAEEATALGLTSQSISQQIRNSDAKVSAGQLRNQQFDLLIEVSGELDSLARIEQIPIYFQGNGNFVRLGDIAQVRKTITHPQSSIAMVSGKPSVTLGLFVRPQHRIDLWTQEANEVLSQFEKELPAGIALERVFEQNRYVSTRLSILLFNLAIGGTAVFFVILVLMGWRNAIAVSLALPLASLMVLTGMRFQGIPVHQMSVTGLIIALGLLIDNAIVVVDEISSKIKSGMSPGHAVQRCVSHLFLPLLGSTLTTAFAFAPIALMPGPAGEFVGSIAINVIMAIASSFFLAMTIVPAIAATLNSGRSFSTGHPAWLTQGIYIPWLGNWYDRLLHLVTNRPAIGLMIGGVFPIIGFIQAGNLKEQFFPPADRDQLHIEIELSPQSAITETLDVANRMRNELLTEENIQRVDWFVGESAPTFYYNLIARRRNASQYGQAIVQLDSSENIAEIIHGLQDKLDHRFPSARVLVRQLEQGPPFDAPVEVRVFGPNLDDLKAIGTRVRQVLVETPGVVHTRSELQDSLPKIELAVDEENARRAGLELATIASQVDAWTEGAVGGSIIESTEELPVRVRMSDQRRGNLSALGSVELVGSASHTAGFAGVPLSALASIGLTSDFGSIPHLAGKRMNEIQVYIPAGVLPSVVLQRFEKRLEKAGFELPSGYAIRYGGEAAKRDEAIGSLMANVGVLLVLMIATLVLSFGSFRLAGMIGVVAVLSVGLGMGSLWLYGYPFGFMAIVGTMGLIGVAINDSIVVLAAIRADSTARGGNAEAIARQVRGSTRHIISTSLTTMAGFAPLILGGGGFWPPLAIAIAGGVGGATIIALLFVPSAYILLTGRQLPVASSTG